MAEKLPEIDGKCRAEPETEEEWLTDSEPEEAEAIYPVSRPGNGVVLVSSVLIKFNSKPNLWLASLDRKMMVVNKVMDRVAYWPSKPPTVEELKLARDVRLKREEDRKDRVSRRKGNCDKFWKRPVPGVK